LNRAISISSSVYSFNQQTIPAWSRAAILLSMSCLLIPRGVELQLGTIMIDSSRIVLVLFGLMAANQVLSGKITIRATVADWLLLVHIVIISLTALYHEGLREGLELTSTVLIDRGLAYFVARVAIRNLQCFRYYIRVVLVIAAISAVFALEEMLTGYSIIRAVYHVFFPKVAYIYLTQQRLSFFRASAAFRVEILFGLYCATVFALAVCVKPYYLKMGRTLYKGCLVLCAAGVFASLSSGPWMAFGLCLFCLAYSRLMRNVRGRWRLFLFTIGAGFLFLSVASNRGPIKLMINYFAIVPSTGYIRIMMWESVWALMSDYWLLGWGWGADWPRHEWYIWSSVDSFYAVQMVRSGIFAALSIIAFFAYSWYRIGNVMDREQFAAGEARGWILATVCLAVTAITVDIFGNLIFATYFLLGAGQTLFNTCESMSHPNRV